MKIKSTFTAPLLVIAVMLIFAVPILFNINLDRLAYQDNICLAVIVIQLLGIMVPCAFYTKLKGEGFTKKLRIAPFGLEKLVVTLLATAALILGDILLKLVLYNIGAISDDYSIYYHYLNGTDPGVLYSLITFAVVPAICEEFMFRSILCAEYESSGIATAVIGSAVLYAMFGMNFGYFPVYFFAGIMFALVLYITRSVFASMLCHVCYSIFELAAGKTVRTIIIKPQSMGFLIFAVTVLFLLCLAVLFGECEKIYYRYALNGEKNKHTDKKEKQDVRAFTSAILAPPFLVTVLVFVVTAVLFGTF